MTREEILLTYCNLYEPKLLLTIDDFISVNHYLAYRSLIKNGKPMAMSYKTKEAKDFQKKFTEYVIEQVALSEWEMSDNPYQHYFVDTVFYFPRTDMDCNNYWKVGFDAITDSGCVWLDDNMACERVMGVYYDNKNPRIEYVIHPTDFYGIWGKVDRYNDFVVKNCLECNKTIDKCAVLRKAREGRIQDGVTEYKCQHLKARGQK